MAFMHTVRSGEVGWGWARYGQAGRDGVGQGEVWSGPVRPGTVWQGLVWFGGVRWRWGRVNFFRKGKVNRNENRCC
jgi:hypothetical protein